MTDSNPEHCPLHRVRELPVQEALDWLTGLSTDDKDFLLKYHCCCVTYSIEVERAASKKPVQRRKTAARKATPPRA